jgi:hypothetical protein
VSAAAFAAETQCRRAPGREAIFAIEKIRRMPCLAGAIEHTRGAEHDRRADAIFQPIGSGLLGSISFAFAFGSFVGAGIGPNGRSLNSGVAAGGGGSCAKSG